VTGLCLAVSALFALPAAAQPRSGPTTCGPQAVDQAIRSTAPANLCVPAAATDATSTQLVWRTSDRDTGVVDYVVFADDRPIGTAERNATVHSAGQPYVDAFRGANTDGFAVRTIAHTFTVTGLRPHSTHRFTVRALHADGSLSPASNAVRVTTKASPKQLRITDRRFGAVGDGSTLSTHAIQTAIDSCSGRDCTVVVPAGRYMTGALFLHSDMTLELEHGAVLVGSDRWQDYPLDKGYYLYPVPSPLPTSPSYTAYLRPPSLINVLPRDRGRAEARRQPGRVAQNVRIIGDGTIDGNGWKSADPATVIDEAGNTLPQMVASNADKVAADGILAANQVQHALDHPEDLYGSVNPTDPLTTKDVYGNYRSSLITVMGTKDVYIGGITLTNPAYHGLMLLDDDNVTVSGASFLTYDANNGDGIELGGVDNAIVTDNFFDTGDDDVNFAAGQGEYGENGRPSQNAWIFDNYMRRGHGGIAIGSHTAAWVQNVLAEDNVFHLTETGALRMKSTSDMGGGARQVLFRNSAASCLKTSAVIASLSYSQASSGYLAAGSATFRNIQVSNVSVDGNNTTECGMATSEKNPVIDIEAGPAISPTTDTVGPFRFDRVRFRNVNSTDIAGLTGSTFRRVCFGSVLSGTNPWRLDEYSTHNRFVKGKPMPGEVFTPSNCVG
jgi:exo-poly-alpha-galacturonosidase